MFRQLPRRLLSSAAAPSGPQGTVPASLRAGTKLPSLTLNYEPSTNARFYLLAGGEEVSIQDSWSNVLAGRSLFWGVKN